MTPMPGTGAPCARILVVEDEPQLRSLLADELRDAGFGVLEASSADDALKHIDAGLGVDLVFTDVQMPGTIDGIDLALMLHDRFPSVPVIVTSGNLGERCLNGVDRFVPKPYRLEAAVAIVFEALGPAERRR